ncbi:MAG: hypothetical protein EOO36_00045 [Cytophagaceae bacterium]|nr:MAG: hypothetical protein EOO36_00045 [Cytophagaceae bacterium]
MRLASGRRLTQAAARTLDINPKRIYKWQKEAFTPVAATQGAESDPPWPPSCASCVPTTGDRRRS